MVISGTTYFICGIVFAMYSQFINMVPQVNVIKFISIINEENLVQ
jgi:hypothetical protein